MRILISGSTGFLGTALTEALEREGHAIVRLVRPGSSNQVVSGSRQQTVAWDPVAGYLDAASAEDADALVHLAGASIAGGRWNSARKALLRTSRVDATRQLIEALAKLQRPPRVIVASSAVGYYGNRGDELLTEASASGDDFLAALARDWEAEAARGAEFGARVVRLRFGIILDAHGGALPRMATPFRLGVGGRLGTGRQWMSWLTLTEAIRMIQFSLVKEGLAGPVNAVSPTPARNADFTRELARTLRRPALFPAPAFALRLLLGEMADSLLLASQKAIPSRLESSGYPFLQKDLAGAIWQAMHN